MSRRFALDVAVPLVAVCVLAATAFAVTGVWPPLVAVESGSMEPGVERGDLVVVTSPDRAPDAGIVGSAEGGPERFGRPGDVVVYSPPDRDGPPILHRVAFAVEAGEDWTVRGDDARYSGDCESLSHCPAPHDGYVTYGDANGEYDQSAGIAPVVHESWVHSKAGFGVPLLGWIRLGVDAAIAVVGIPGVVAGSLVGGAAVGGGVALVVERVRGEPLGRD